MTLLRAHAICPAHGVFDQRLLRNPYTDEVPDQRMRCPTKGCATTYFFAAVEYETDIPGDVRLGVPFHENIQQENPGEP